MPATHTRLYCVSTCHKGCSLLNITLTIWDNSQASTIVNVGNETGCIMCRSSRLCACLFFPQNNCIESFVVHIGQRETQHLYNVTAVWIPPLKQGRALIGPRKSSQTRPEPVHVLSEPCPARHINCNFEPEPDFNPNFFLIHGCILILYVTCSHLLLRPTLLNIYRPIIFLFMA